MKKKYASPEFEFFKLTIKENLLASAEGDPNAVIVDGDDDVH